MKAAAFAIAGIITIFSTAMPQSARSSTYEFYYAYTAGALAAICDLHMNGMISTNTVKEANKNFLNALGNNAPAAATREAVKVVLEQEDFKDCPIRNY